MVNSARADFDIEDRADAVRRALDGLIGTQKSNSGSSISCRKPVMSMQPPAASKPLQTHVPRISMQSTVAAAPKTEVSHKNFSTPTSQPGVVTMGKAGGTSTGGTSTVQEVQELLCQLRMTDKQPIRGLEGDTVTCTPVPEVSVAAQPVQRHGQVLGYSPVPEVPVTAQPAQRQAQVRRNRDVGRNGKKKTEIEKENDRLLDEMESLGEPFVEVLGETPVAQNERLRREATIAMLKHSFFVKKRPTPPESTRGSGSTASGDFSDR